ncbi:N-formylglutamate amidohydrolase [Zunongwangia sp. F363]|uniref:N-formylglutamate amidohydrolase n=1 Tax=Autumnicola tepida TaxID=3075595 RepID=A0ABU3C609_9FLAO|nr:N-formylglutamate amidohydrolase [Zunongwangia sp. F363]MDT0641766.1 N-formylglutamate amidohydrolase [Zunongwangia sp. F363]
MMKLVLTCEHAFNTIPGEYLKYFSGAAAVLNSHRGYDPGAYDLFKKLSDLSDFAIYQKSGRLLVEVNRSLDHPQLYSEYTAGLNKVEKELLLSNYYFLYRNTIEDKIDEFIEEKEKVFHLSIHTFTPELEGEIRNADIGILFDPERAEEKQVTENLKEKLEEENSQYVIRYNYPYLGTSDGFTTWLRQKFPEHYCGIELEINQKFVEENKMDEKIKQLVFTSVEECLKKS